LIQNKTTTRKNKADEQLRAENAADAAEAFCIEEDKKLAEMIKVGIFGTIRSSAMTHFEVILG